MYYFNTLNDSIAEAVNTKKIIRGFNIMKY